MSQLGELGARRLMSHVFYSSPWEQLAHRLWKLDTLVLDDDGHRLSGGVPEGGLRDRLAVFCQDRDHAWREKYVQRGEKPPAKWKRK